MMADSRVWWGCGLSFDASPPNVLLSSIWTDGVSEEFGRFGWDGWEFRGVGEREGVDMVDIGKFAVDSRIKGTFTYVIRSHMMSRVHHMTLRLGCKREILLHPKSSWDSLSSVTTLWAVGLQQVQSSIPSIIMIIPFTHLSLNPVPLHVLCFRTSLCFMFLFYFAFSFPLFYFCSPNPDPDICPIPATLTWFSSIIICSEPHVCSSVWNRHWLSLELIIWTSKPSSVPHLKFEDSRRLVAQHISWSRVLAKHIEPQYALGPSPAHNSSSHLWKLCIVVKSCG